MLWWAIVRLYPPVVSHCLRGVVFALRVEKGSILVPVLKKGDLSCCDNWRSISLLDVMRSKLFARVLNDRLQFVVGETVSDSQCGFTVGRGCLNSIFYNCIHQLVNIILSYFCYLLAYARPMIVYPEKPFGVLCRSTVYPML